MTDDARNTASNFTPLRLLLALMVVLGHFQILTGVHSPPWPFCYSAAAVDCFFVVSGYLISASFDRDPNLWRFFMRRIFRIYPLYAVVIVAQACILVALQTHPVPLMHVLRYIVANAAFANFLQRDLGDGSLAALPLATLNPSVWTLKVELGFYLILPFVWMGSQWLGRNVLGVLFVASALCQWTLNHAGHPELAKQLPGQVQFFVLGLALYRLRGWPAITFWQTGLGAAALGLALTALLPFHVPVVYPLVVTGFVAIVALKLPALPMKRDISYGVYLVHGPVIQLSLLLGFYRTDWVGLGATVVVVIALAWMAERLVETPGIALGRRLMRSIQERPAALPTRAALP